MLHRNNHKLVYGSAYVALGAALLFVLTGCATTQPSARLEQRADTATAGPLKVGDAAPDFGFTDANGRYTRLSAVQGSVTMLVFPENAAQAPDTDFQRACAELARAASEPDRRVVVVSVGARETTPAAEGMARSEPRAGDFVLAADTDDTLRRVYAGGTAGRYVIIDNTGHVAATGTFQDAESLRRPLRDVVRALSEENTDIERSMFAG